MADACGSLGKRELMQGSSGCREPSRVEDYRRSFFGVRGVGCSLNRKLKGSRCGGVRLEVNLHPLELPYSSIQERAIIVALVHKADHTLDSYPT